MGRTSDAKDRLIEVGSRLIHTRGYNAVGVQEICEEAGVNKGSFYHFFPSKKELVLAIIERHEGFMTQQVQEIFSLDLSIHQKFEAFFQSIFGMACEIKETCGVLPGCPIGNLALELTTFDHEIQARIAQCFGNLEKFFADRIREAQEHGECEGVDPSGAAKAMVAYFQGMTLLAKANNSPEVFKDIYERGLLMLGPTPQEEWQHPAGVLQHGDRSQGGRTTSGKARARSL
ncbi:MAG: TetR/AcrR family transcriptional regulator [Candidatus Omnitrophica bacterium]|nr:TetR/AcrR family transcriptional regulator [Candidatus Omnitrophota bacterium]